MIPNPITVPMTVSENATISLTVNDGIKQYSMGVETAINVTANDKIFVATKEEWDSQPLLIGQAGIVYVYSNQYTNPNGDAVPGFKVGDGLAYLIDLPFNDDIMARFMADDSRFITDEERAFWNNKVTAYIDAENLENLVLSKE